MSGKYAIIIRDVREFDAPWRVKGIQWAIVDDSGRIVAIAVNEDEAKDKLRELEGWIPVNQNLTFLTEIS